MKLVYIVSKYTNPNSNYKLHIPDPYNNSMPLCSSKKAFSIEFVEGGKPTCKKCLKYWAECEIYPL